MLTSAAHILKTVEFYAIYVEVYKLYFNKTVKNRKQGIESMSADHLF